MAQFFYIKKGSRHTFIARCSRCSSARTFMRHKTCSAFGSTEDKYMFDVGTQSPGGSYIESKCPITNRRIIIWSKFVFNRRINCDFYICFLRRTTILSFNCSFGFCVSTQRDQSSCTSLCPAAYKMCRKYV
jgi:hypothetical protein